MPNELTDDVSDKALSVIESIPSGSKVGLLKAINHLFGGLTNYAAAWARRPLQAVEDKTDAKSLVLKAVAEAAAERASQDPDLVNAALETFLPKELRRQENKARVVEQAANALIVQDTDDNTGESVDEDWLNSFERFCEDATSEKMQQMWGRVLAGELSSPRSFSKSTVRLLSELDQSTARRFEKLAPYATGEFVFSFLEEEHTLSIADLLDLESAGLLSSVGGGIGWAPKIEDDSLKIIGREYGLYIKAKDIKRVSLDVVTLTPSGVQLSAILPRGDEEALFRKVSRYLSEHAGNFSFDLKVVGIALCRKDGTRKGDPFFKKVELLYGSDPWDTSNTVGH